MAYLFIPKDSYDPAGQIIGFCLPESYQDILVAYLRISRLPTSYHF